MKRNRIKSEKGKKNKCIYNVYIICIYKSKFFSIQLHCDYYIKSFLVYYIASIMLREVIKIFEIFETKREHTAKAAENKGERWHVTFKKN